MTTLTVTSAQASEAGVKPANDDACGVRVPEAELLTTKGVAAVIADGMSGSDAGKEASEACVQGFLSDYFSTPESWTVKTSGQKVLTALNRWLHGQGHRLYGSPRGMVTTLSALVLKSTTGYLFHVGDTRIYRLRGGEFECLTYDHRVQVSEDKNYLSRAMGIELNIDIDYRTVPLEAGDLFLLTTDGIHDFLSDAALKQTLQRHPDDPASACEEMIAAALANDGNDNLTAQIVRVDSLPAQDENEVYQQLTALPFPPPLEPGMILDGYRIVRQLHASKRTELYLAIDEETGEQVALKAPSVNYTDDPTYIDLFLHEAWVGKRIDNPHVQKAREHRRPRRFLYCVTEYIEGQNLRQWMHDHPRPTLIEVRNLVEQVAAGLRAFHRMEMIHQDLKPENIMIDKYSTVKLIDFGSTKIAGIEEITTPVERVHLLGTENYTAPEYLQGYAGSNRSDTFSLGVITYEMLTGKLPYGEGTAKHAAHRRVYASATRRNPEVPAWVDGALEKALHPDPARRYETLSEFIYDLAHPNPKFIKQESAPLLERNPVGFWRTAAIVLLVLNLVLVYLLSR